MVADSKRSPRSSVRSARCVPKRGAEAMPPKVYKFSKLGHNRGQVAPSEKRDHTAYDYSDEM